MPADHWRPKTRADCKLVPRPCPFVGCRHNLTIDVTPNGSIRWRQPDNWQASFDGRDNCALDVAARGPHKLEEIALLVGVTRERVRQEINAACDRVKDKMIDSDDFDIQLDLTGYDESTEDAFLRSEGFDPANAMAKLKFRGHAPE